MVSLFCRNYSLLVFAGNSLKSPVITALSDDRVGCVRPISAIFPVLWRKRHKACADWPPLSGWPLMLTLDRHIAIQSGWIAGPAFGVAMMAAPVYFHL
jgi:hypothetical protein